MMPAIIIIDCQIWDLLIWTLLSVF